MKCACMSQRVMNKQPTRRPAPRADDNSIKKATSTPLRTHVTRRGSAYLAHCTYMRVLKSWLMILLSGTVVMAIMA